MDVDADLILPVGTRRVRRPVADAIGLDSEPEDAPAAADEVSGAAAAAQEEPGSPVAAGACEPVGAQRKRVAVADAVLSPGQRELLRAVKRQKGTSLALPVKWRLINALHISALRALLKKQAKRQAGLDVPRAEKADTM